MMKDMMKKNDRKFNYLKFTILMLMIANIIIGIYIIKYTIAWNTSSIKDVINTSSELKVISKIVGLILIISGTLGLLKNIKETR